MIAYRRAVTLVTSSFRVPKNALVISRNKYAYFFVQRPPSVRSPPSLIPPTICRTSSSASKSSHDHVASDAAELTHVGRLKDLWRKYGVVAIGTYMTMYGAVLGSIYLAIDQGWLRTTKGSHLEMERRSDENFNLVTSTNKLVKIAEDWGIAQYLEIERVNSKTGTLLLAWIVTKFTEPLRLGVTIAVTPRIARFLGRAPKLPPKMNGQTKMMIDNQTLAKKKQKT